MLNCIYAKNGVMRVVSDEERHALVDSVAWFDSPLCLAEPAKSEEEIQAEIDKAQADIDALKLQHAEELQHEERLQNQERRRPRQKAKAKSRS